MRFRYAGSYQNLIVSPPETVTLPAIELCADVDLIGNEQSSRTLCSGNDGRHFRFRQNRPGRIVRITDIDYPGGARDNSVERFQIETPACILAQRNLFDDGTERPGKPGDQGIRWRYFDE